jgi:hypothetical protein
MQPVAQSTSSYAKQASRLTISGNAFASILNTCGEESVSITTQ